MKNKYYKSVLTIIGKCDTMMIVQDITNKKESEVKNMFKSVNMNKFNNNNMITSVYFC